MPRDAVPKAATSAQLVTYDVSEAWISATREKFSTLSCDTPAGYEETRLAIANVRETRVAIEKRRVELKADALAYGRLVDSEAKRFTNLLLEIEEPLKAKKAVIDDAAARKKAEAEAERIRAIEAEIAANRAKQEAEARALREAEEKRLAEERAALAVERKKIEEAQAMMDARRLAEEARAEAARRAEQERLDAAAAAERARIDAEREKLAAERRAEEERQRIERAAIEAERRRVQAEREKAERAEFEQQAKARAEKEAAEKIERDRTAKAQREAERLRLLPDLEKVDLFIAAIRALKAPDVIDVELNAVLSCATDRLEEAADRLEASAKEYR